jgi:c-di-GMP-binding flagellar brake protein YcgR
MDQGAPRGAERRRHPRFELLAQVHVKQAQADYIMELDNISESGARLHLGSLKRPRWIALQRVLTISIVHPIDLDNIDVKGRVVRVEEDLENTVVAVCFVDLDETTERGIARLLETARGPVPPPLPR